MGDRRVRNSRFSLPRSAGLTFHPFHVIHLRQRRMRVVGQRGEDDGGGHGEGEVGGVVVVRDGGFRGGGCGCHCDGKVLCDRGRGEIEMVERLMD